MQQIEHITCSTIEAKHQEKWTKKTHMKAKSTIQLTSTNFTHNYARTYFIGIVVATAKRVVLQKLCQELSLIKKIKTLNSITGCTYI